MSFLYPVHYAGLVRIQNGSTRCRKIIRTIYTKQQRVGQCWAVWLEIGVQPARSYCYAVVLHCRPSSSSSACFLHLQMRLEPHTFVTCISRCIAYFVGLWQFPDSNRKCTNWLPSKTSFFGICSLSTLYKVSNPWTVHKWYISACLRCGPVGEWETGQLMLVG